MIKLLLAIVGLIAPVAVSAAKSVEYYNSGVWTVYKNEEDCAMIGEYSGGGIFWISYNFGLEKVSLFFSDQSFRSVETDQKYRLKLVFVKGDRFDDGWGIVEARGSVLESMRGLFLSLKSNEAINDVARSDTVALLRDDVVVVSFGLKGTGPGIAKLRQCAKEVWRVNPSDPLVGAGEK